MAEYASTAITLAAAPAPPPKNPRHQAPSSPAGVSRIGGASGNDNSNLSLRATLKHPRPAGGMRLPCANVRELPLARRYVA